MTLQLPEGHLLCFIFSNSLKEASKVQNTKKRVVQAVEVVLETVLDRPVSLNKVSDSTVSKIGHLLEFFTFAALFTSAAFSRRGFRGWDSFSVILFPCTFVALTDEHLQNLGKGRNCQVSDVMIDLSACFLGYALAYAIFYLWERRRKKRGNGVSGS
jgi:VanZ family protein